MRSPTLNELVIDRHRGRDKATGAIIPDPVLDAIGNSLKSARQTGEQIGAAVAALAQDATMTEAARGVRIKSAALSLAEKATRALDEARSRTLAELEKLDKAMAVQAPKDGVEIRAALARLTPREREKAMADPLLAAAALASHPLLSGMSNAEHTMATTRYRREKFPAELDRHGRLSRALADLDRAGNVVVHHTKQLAENPTVLIAEANARRAAEAEAAANAARGEHA